MNWFFSDPHFSHCYKDKNGIERGIVSFERTRFENIQEHDDYIEQSLYSWARKHEGEILWILGDFGDIRKLYIIDNLRYEYNIWCNFVYGNHDKKRDYDTFTKHFQNVYDTPFFLSNRIILSHKPLYPVPEGMLNIHGHTHGAYIDSPQHLCASAHVIGYQPFSDKKVEKALGDIPKAGTKFLFEPYAHLYRFIQEKDDCVYDPQTMKIDLAASRAFQKNRPKNY